MGRGSSLSCMQKPRSCMAVDCRGTDSKGISLMPMLLAQNPNWGTRKQGAAQGWLKQLAMIPRLMLGAAHRDFMHRYDLHT
jgi:hypothetical protein